MPNKILLFADAHIHTHKHSTKRLQDCLTALEWVFETAVERKIENIVFLGDLFQDREKIQVLPYYKTFRILDTYCGGDNPQINLYLLVGNHDMWYADKTDIASVLPFSAIKNVEVISTPSSREIAGLKCDFLPFTINPPESIKTFKTPSRVLFGHIALDGAKLNNFHTADVSVEMDHEVVKVDHHLFKSWERVFLGHYHGEQKLGEVEYIGSPLQLNFAEAFQKKHIVVLDIETLATEYIENKFSPRHLILKQEQLGDYDLDNTFIKLTPTTSSAAGVADLKKNLLEHYNILTFEISSSKHSDEGDVTKQHLLASQQAIAKNDSTEILEAYIDATGTGGLDRALLLEIGNGIRQKSQVN